MARIRVAETATAGFRLIASKPLTVTMWGVAYMLLSLALFAAFWGLGGADLFKTILSAPAGGAPDPTSFTAMSQRLTLMNPLMQLGSLVIRAVLYAAVFRAVLRPRESGFFYLRLGPAELWQALVIFVLAVVIGLSLIPIGLVGAAIGFGGWFGAAAVVPHPWTGWIQGLAVAIAVILCIGALLWVALRLSLAGPMTFDQRTFRVFESWSLTKGSTLKLFLVALLLLVMVIAFALVMDVLLLAVGAVAIGGATGFDPQALAGVFSQPPSVWLPRLAPWLAIAVVVASVLTGFMHAIMLAPWAEAYRQLRPDTDAESAFT